jgi:hypothetical protein
MALLEFSDSTDTITESCFEGLIGAVEIVDPNSSVSPPVRPTARPCVTVAVGTGEGGGPPVADAPVDATPEAEVEVDAGGVLPEHAISRSAARMPKGSRLMRGRGYRSA